VRKGQSLTPEHREKLRQKALGRRVARSNEHNLKIAESLRAYNSTLSEREKMVRYSRPGFFHSEETRHVISEKAVTSFANGRKPASWIEDRAEAARRKFFYGLCKGLVRRCVKAGLDDCSIEQLGYSPSELREHIESQFADGMSWENYGRWHVDHIRPVSSFSKETHVSIVNSLTNLRPLWADENLRRPRKWSQEIES
jgi:hypothetical protein